MVLQNFNIACKEKITPSLTQQKLQSSKSQLSTVALGDLIKLD